jgi:hypothetical protein
MSTVPENIQNQHDNKNTIYYLTQHQDDDDDDDDNNNNVPFCVAQ